MSGFARRLQQGINQSHGQVTTVLAQDNFNRSDGSLGTADIGGSWSTFNNPTWTIVGGTAALTSGANSSAVAILPVSCTAGIFSVDMYLSNNYSNTGLCLLASSDGANYLNIQLNNSSSFNRIAISKRVAGVSTFLVENDAAGLVNGEGYSLCAVLTTAGVTVYLDGVQQLQYTFTAQDLTDLTDSSYVGLRSWWGPSDEDGGSRWDRFLVTTGSARLITTPAAPWQVAAASAGNGQATITWNRAGNGGSALTGYIVTSSAGPSFTVNDPNTTSYLATGLSNVAQTFTVTAVNAVGSSAASSASNSVIPTTAAVPDAPTGVSATAGDSQAVVSWTAPASDGGSAITGYTVTSSPSNIQISVGANSTSASVTGLTNGTAYTFAVVATNAIGNSVASSASNSVTPAAASGGGTAFDPRTFDWAANTGPAAGGYSSLTAYNANTDPTVEVQFTTPNEVITGKDIIGRVRVLATGVTFVGCRIRANTQPTQVDTGSLVYNRDTSGNRYPFTMQYCEIGGYGTTDGSRFMPTGPANYGPVVGVSAFGGVTLQNCLIHHSGDGIRFGAGAIIDTCYVDMHDHWYGFDSAGTQIDTPHPDCSQTTSCAGTVSGYSYNVGGKQWVPSALFLHTKLSIPNESNSSTFLKPGPTGGEITRVTYDGCLFDGGNYTLSGEDVNSFPVHDNYLVGVVWTHNYVYGTRNTSKMTLAPWYHSNIWFEDGTDSGFNNF